MILSEMRQAVLDYLDDPLGELYSPTGFLGAEDEIHKAINEEQRELARLLERVDRTALHAARYFTWGATAGATEGRALPNYSEVALPTEFRRVITLLVVDSSGQHTPYTMVRFQRIAHYPIGDNVAYVRRILGNIYDKAALNFDVVLEDGSATALSVEEVASLATRDVVGFRRANRNPDDVECQMHYASYPADLVDGGNESSLPLDMHSLVPIGAALRLRRANRRTTVQLQAFRDAAVGRFLASRVNTSGMSMVA